MNLTQSEFAAVAANEIKKAKYPVPDTTQMLPFKPVRNACKTTINNLINPLRTATLNLFGIFFLQMNH